MASVQALHSAEAPDQLEARAITALRAAEGALALIRQLKEQQNGNGSAAGGSAVGNGRAHDASGQNDVSAVAAAVAGAEAAAAAAAERGEGGGEKKAAASESSAELQPSGFCAVSARPGPQASPALFVFFALRAWPVDAIAFARLAADGRWAAWPPSPERNEPCFFFVFF